METSVIKRSTKLLSMLFVLAVSACSNEDDTDLSPLTANAPDRSECDTIAADDTVIVSADGRHANPAGSGGGSARPGCEQAFVVDFFSPTAKMASFEPDHEWIKVIPDEHVCFDECPTGTKSPRYQAQIDVYQCTQLRDCESHKYTEMVGTYDIRYDKCAINPPYCTAVPDLEGCWGTNVYPTPIAEDVYGVRMVIKYTAKIERYSPVTSACQQVYPDQLLDGLEYNASGVVRYSDITIEQLGKRPKAEPVE